MNNSVARRVVVGGASILVVTLIVVGLGTAALLHNQQVRALDEALLAAAHERTRPDADDDILVEVEYSESPVEAWIMAPDDARIPEDPARRALETERPIFTDSNGERFALLPFEIYESNGEQHVYDLRGEHRRLAVAAAPKMTLVRSTGPFAVIYSLLATIAALMATITQAHLVRRAFRPLERTRREAEKVTGFGQGARLTEDGPMEIRSLIAAVNALLGRLEDAYLAQRRFTAEAAHELRTPVAAMLGELEVALRGDRSEEEYREVLDSVKEEVHRLRRLVEALTTMVRIDAGQTGLDREPIRAAALADSALRAEAGVLKAAGCEWRLEIDDDPEIEVQRALLETALSNLLRNAARHAPGSQVLLRVGSEDGYAIFIVDDSGPGVPEDERQKLFDRFTRRGDARSRDPDGLGLGLSIAREIARRHGGDCTLETSPLGGLRAHLSVILMNF